MLLPTSETDEVGVRFPKRFSRDGSLFLTFSLFRKKIKEKNIPHRLSEAEGIALGLKSEKSAMNFQSLG